MNNNELIQRIEIEQQHRLQRSEQMIQDKEDLVISNPDSYGDDGELTYEAHLEIEKLSAAVEQYKRGYHNAMEHVKKALQNQPSPLTHSGIERYYE